VGAVVKVVVAPGGEVGGPGAAGDDGEGLVGLGPVVEVGSGPPVVEVVVVGTLVCGVVGSAVASLGLVEPSLFPARAALAAAPENPDSGPLDGTMAKTETSVNPPRAADDRQARGRARTAVSVPNDFGVTRHRVGHRMGSPYLLVARAQPETPVASGSPWVQIQTPRSAAGSSLSAGVPDQLYPAKSDPNQFHLGLMASVAAALFVPGALFRV
jgi:hypothetical protein